MKYLIFLLGVLSTHSMDIVVPAYFHPSKENLQYWDQMAAAARNGTPITVIMNPSNGPGALQSASYTSAINKIQLAGATIFGYVSTQKGTKPINEVKTDIGNYLNCYNPHGIFIDGVGKNISSVDYYKEIYTYVKKNGSHLIVVVGSTEKIPDFYISKITVANRFVNFADTHSKYAAADVNKPTHSYIHMVYNTTESELAKDLQLAMDRSACGIYLTDRTGSGKNAALPGYWNKLVAAVNAINNS